MKALAKIRSGVGGLDLIEIEDPQIASNQVLVEVKATGICGSDIRTYNRDSEIKTPIVLGHEFSGQIVEVGAEVKEWEVGDRIASECFPQVCGSCYYCNIGEYHLCSTKTIVGAFTKFLALPPWLLHRIPAHLDYPKAALVQPCADVLNAVTRNAKVFPGDVVVVLGPGPIGLLTTQVAKAQGATKVIQTGHRGVRLKIAEKIGADVTIAVEEEDPVKKINELTEGRGADVIFETSGAADATIQAFDMVRKQGQIIFISAPLQPVELDVMKILAKALVVKGSLISKWIDYERAIKLIAHDQVVVDPMITHQFPLSEWEKAFNAIFEKRAGKVLLYPG